ncbi:MAG: hypothetical protein RLZZ01_2578 [Actinomycetota bacterium]
MPRRRFTGPVREEGDGFVVDLGEHAAPVVRRMLDELRDLLTREVDDPDAAELLARLFPVVHPDDPDAEAEYQRLMRDELVQSKLAAFRLVDTALAGDGRLDEAGLVAFMQSLNSLRLVLGRMLDITDEFDDGFDDEAETSAEHELYGYLSWLLEWSVQTISRR